MTQATEDREGIRFYGFLGESKDGLQHVRLYVEGQKKPVYRTVLNRREHGQAVEQLVDAAFQEFVTVGTIGLGGFRPRVKNPIHVAILEQAQRERGVAFGDAVIEKRPWYLRTHRFLRAHDFTGKNLRFILTTDKSDLDEGRRAAWEKFRAGASLEEVEADLVRAAGRMKREARHRVMEEERRILEDLPQDPKLREAFQEAVAGKRRVMLVVKGFRPMYLPNHPHGFNYFWFEGYEANYGTVSVPTICRLAGVDPRLVQDAYFYFRNHERWPRLRPGLDEEIAQAEKQVVTNLFPFPEIGWRREDGSTGEIYHLVHLVTVKRTPPFLSEEEIRRLSQPGKAISKSYARHITKKSRLRRKAPAVLAS